jgi:hypothetical protein
MTVYLIAGGISRQGFSEEIRYFEKKRNKSLFATDSHRQKLDEELSCLCLWQKKDFPYFKKLS